MRGLVNKKQKNNIIMGYFKPNTNKAIKLAIAIKSLTGVLAGSTFFMGDAKAAFIIFLVGAVANEVINFLSDTNENPSPAETNPEH